MAGTPAKVMNGARAQVMVGNKIIGWISSLSYNITLDTQDAYVLGRTGPAEISYVASEPVTGTMTGWHVIDAGAYASLGLPTLQDLLTAPYTQLAVFDRVTNKRIGLIKEVRLGGVSSGFAARALSEATIPFRGILFSDETVDNAEAPGASDLP